MYYDNADVSGLRKFSKTSPDSMVANYDANMRDFLSRVHGSSFSDDFETISDIRKQLLHLKKESYNKYLDDLLYPEKSLHSKIPATVPFPTSSFKMHNTLTITPNASGNFCFTFNPFFLANGAFDSFFLNTHASLVGNASNNNFISTSIGQNIPAIYADYRLVSSSIIVSPKNSVLNMQGTLSGSCIIDEGLLSFPGTGNIQANAAQYGNFTFTDDAFYNQVVQAKDGLRMLYFPLDITYEKFIQWGTGAGGFNWLCYGQGLQPSVPCIRVDWYANFEATPNPSYLQFIPRSLGNSGCSEDSKKDAIREAQRNAVTKWSGEIISTPKITETDPSALIDKTLDVAGKVINTLNKVSEAQKIAELQIKEADKMTTNTDGKGISMAEFLWRQGIQDRKTAEKVAGTSLDAMMAAWNAFGMK